ncbi:MAG: diaminopimelate decarboxylase [Ignavibacteriales bacterium]|nr:diaminopimelate decarboxylase [Ignavibacteriales bacterium]
MQYKENSAFSYQAGELFVEDVPVKEIAAIVGTPVLIYSKTFFKQQYSAFTSAFAAISPRVFYASKANFNTAVIRTFVEAGSGVDVNSAGELYRALQAGAKPRNIVFAGVGKTDAEITYGLEQEVFLFKSESREEVAAINRLAHDAGKTANVALRVNPDVDPKTHPYISTSLANNKFGISFDEAKGILTCGEFSNIRFTGLDMHLGSQITTTAPYIEAVKKLAVLLFELREAGVHLTHLDLGGGFGVSYQPGEPEFDFSELPGQLAEILLPLNVTVFFEPGRFLTANGGILLTKVLYTKANGNKKFAIVDAGMTDLMRPVLYNAYHHIQPVSCQSGAEFEYDIVGPVCESSDFFAKSRLLPELGKDTLLAVCSTGAYTDVMGSNYNARLRPPEILVEGSNFKTIRRREKLEDLLRLEV